MADTIPSTTTAELAQRVSNLLDWAETRDGKWTAWVTGTETGGPLADGRYPLPYSEDEDVLVECPKLLANMLVGPAANAAAALAAAEAARDLAIANATASGEDRAAAAAALAAAVAARDLTLSYRDQAGTHEANAQAHKDAAEAAQADVASRHADIASKHDTVVADAAQTALDRAAVAADKATVADDKGLVAADKATVAADRAAAAASAQEAAQTAAGIADVAAQAAQVDEQHAAVVAARADVEARQADITDRQSDVAAKQAQVATDTGTVAADKATVAADKATALAARDTAVSAKDLAVGRADEALVSRDAVEADRAEVAANLSTIQAAQADVIERQSDVSSKAAAVAADKDTVDADRVASEAARDLALQYRNEAEDIAGSVNGPVLQAQLDDHEVRLDVIEAALPTKAGQAELDALAAQVGETTGGMIASTRQDIGRLLMAVSELKGNQFGTPNGIADLFTDQDGVDLTASANQDWLEVGGIYSNAASGAGAAPAMTSNTAPTGHSVTGNDNVPANNWVAFSNKNSAQADNYYQSNFANGCSITRIFPNPVKMTQYRMATPGAPDNWAALGQPRAWQLFGSNNGSSWTILDDYVVATALGPGQMTTRNLTPPAAYTHYRWVITASAGSTTTFGSYVLIGNIYITLGGTSAALDLRSTAYDSAAVPNKGYLVALASGEDPIVPGTHLRGYISRSGGADWVEAQLTAGQLSNGFTLFEAPEVDLTGLPPGTSMKWRLTTTNDVRVSVDGVLLMWS